MKKKGLSLLEILISTILLALLISSLAYVFVAAKRLIAHSRSRATAAELACRYLEPLSMQVSQQNWSSNCLGTGQSAVCDNPVQSPDITEPSPPSPDNMTWVDSTTATNFTRHYDFVDIDLGTAPNTPHSSFVRRVSLRIQWNERTSQ